MQQTVKLTLICLSVVLALLPLTHGKPGVPGTLKADEPAYFLAAMSLVEDGDLRCEPKDLARLFQEYPYRPAYNLILSTDDGWHTVFFGKPYIFSFLAAPFAALWGANGLVFFNSLLLVAMIWMGTFYLSRYNPDWLAALFSVGFFLISTTYRYVYWLQPELLNMFATAACLFFGLHAFDPRKEPHPASASGRWRERLRSNELALVISASTLALGVYNKPMLVAIGLPVCVRLLRLRRWRDLAIWLVSSVVAIAVIAGIAVAFTGHPTAYLGIDRLGFNIHTPHAMPIEPIEPSTDPAAPEKELGKETAGWWWIFNVPVFTLAELGEDLKYFFIGRHTGLFLYQPFSLLALGLFAAFGLRKLERWVLLAALALVALFCLTFLSHNWHGGGGFVGNRYFIMVYPAFLFLVTRIRPDWIVVAGYAAGGLFVSSLLFSPFGLAVPSPTLQAHARNHPFQPFPVEHSLLEIPGYTGYSHSGIFFRGRKDHLRVEGHDLWITGGEDAVIWMQSLEEIKELTFDIRSQAPGNEVVLRVEGAEARLIAGSEPQRVVLRPSRPTLVRTDRHRANWQEVLAIKVYRMEIRTATGELPRWRDVGEQFFYLGCSLTLIDEEVVVRTRGDAGIAPTPIS